MAKQIKDLRVYDLVVCSNHPEATVWRVVGINGYRIQIVDALLTFAHPNIAPQENDISLFTRPNKAQLDAFNSANQ